MNSPMPDARNEILETIRRHSGLGMAVGVLAIIAGMLAVSSPMYAGLKVALIVGVLLIVSGVSRMFLAFRMGSFGHGLVVFLIGLISIVVGGDMVVQPGIALKTLTLILAIYFLVSGIFEIVWALRLRPIAGWGWTMAGGIVTLILGLIIWRQFPVSGLWAIGTLVGIQLILAGVSLMSICSSARRAPATSQAA